MIRGHYAAANSTRMKLRPLLRLLVALLPVTATAAPVQTPHVQAELIAEHTALAHGEGNWLALRLIPEDGWHVYWQNPGDSGLATKLNWTLPAGVSAGAIHWPYPHTEKLGDLTNYGYADDTLHLVPLTVATDVPTGQALALSAKASWLVCKDVCIPGSATLALELPVVRDKPVADARWTALFANARAQLPQPLADARAAFSTEGGDFSLQIETAGLDASAHYEFFPLASDLVSHSAPQRIATDAQGLRLSQALSPYFLGAPVSVEGVLVTHAGKTARAWTITAQPGTVTPVTATTPPAATATPADSADVASLPLILLFALLGGLILNLMPCVFPVLSLKALALVQAREQSAAQQRAQALAYTAGVVLSCTAVALLLLGLRAGGAALGWGFQLQSPAFVGALAYLMFALGLSLSGVAEFGTRWMGAGQSLAQRDGLSGSFFTGVLATIVASPCTAPFMGTALGYAITQPLAVSLLVFAALGVGLALPFLLLGFFPRLAALLPKPGAWMETFKQVMAFPLYLTAVWLVWVLARQTGVDGAAVVLCGAVLIGFALWLWRRAGVFALVLRLAALAGALALLAAPQLEPAGQSAAPSQGAYAEEPYSAARLAELRGAGRTVFVNLTADWCITCKVNERVALSSSRVHAAFAEREVAWLTGDWTRSDPAITELLAQFGRNGVPLYLIYVKGAEPRVLPQVLTPDIVIDSLNN